MDLKVRIDQKRLGRKWHYPRVIRVCREDGQQVAVITLDPKGTYIRISHAEDFTVYDQIWMDLGKITIPTPGGTGGTPSG